MNVHHLLSQRQLEVKTGRSLDEVGPTGSLVPKGDDEEPSDIISRLKEISSLLKTLNTGTLVTARST